MTVAEMIAQRTAKLTAIKDSSNAAVTAKGGTAADDLSGLPAAIESITSGGGALPDLSTPAAAGDVIAGKEYIDGEGAKRTGTLVVCDTVYGVETVTYPGTGLTVELESSADGSTSMLTLREPNLLPENIVAGSSIFGILGTAKKLRVETGTITPAEDTASLELPCTASPKMFVVLATDAAMDSITADNVAAMVSAAGYGKTFPTGTDGSHKDRIIAAVTLHLASGKISVSGVTCAVSPSVTVGAYSSYRWKAGLEYQWTAYYWEDT